MQVKYLGKRHYSSISKNNMTDLKEKRKKQIKQDWQDDLSKYPARPWLKEISIIALAWYRHGQHVDNMKDGVLKKISQKVYWVVFHLIEVVTGVSIPKSVKIGGGLRIYHFGNVFVHENTVIGENCILRQGVTLGNRYNDEKAPTLGDNIELGAYAQVLGGVYLGDGCKVGAMSVVLHDVPVGKTVCGNPGKVIK